jgi:hypothetical protein
MAIMIRSEVAWLKEHAESKDGILRCKKTGADIGSVTVGRSIWHRPLNAGSGEVRQVLHVACLECTPNAVPPAYGAPIYDDELVEARVNPRG